MTILVKIAYDGTNYHGFQIQDDVITIFGVFQEALLKILGHKTDIKGCSRTDSGVHAACYYLSFETEKQLNIPRLPLALNANLPLDIRVLEAKQVADGFHARYDCKGKQYTYNIRNSHIDDPFTNKYYWRVPSELDTDKMDRAAQYFVGTHDFAGFMTQGSSQKTTVRTVNFLEVRNSDDLIEFEINANAYLYNMVRIISGTLLYVGIGKIKPCDIPEIIKSTDRTRAGITAEPQGLYLKEILY